MSATDELSEEQKHYLQGFVAAAGIVRSARGLPSFAATLHRNGEVNGHANGNGPTPVAGPPGKPTAEDPELIHYRAQDRVIAEGKKLCPEEEAKRKKNALDIWDELRDRAAKAQYPRGADVLLTKFHGLFYVAPAQDSFMCRLRIPGGIMSSAQFRGVADASEQFGGGYVHVTTRANLQIREIRAEHSINLLMALQDLGIVARGSGADNIRNVTASPTAGIDAQELIDTRPLAREMHYYILHHREMYGLPRKFNIAFDGGGTISALEDTNDIGFSAVRVGEGKAVPAGVYFRMALGGITGHQDFARDTGVLLKPGECVPVAAAIVRVFTDNGDRTDRKKARMKYVLDRWGLDKYVEETEKHLPARLTRFPLDQCEPRPPIERYGHIGVHPQRQPGHSYVGVLLPVGRLEPDQMRAMARIADRHGSGTIRLTVWQNLLISDILDEEVPTVLEQLTAIGVGWSATNVRGGLVACTGNFGCKFANADTKRHALAIADHLDARVELDAPLNIHVTGCPNSCAQHYIGDIGLLGTKVAAGDDLVEGYHLYLGGGYGAEQDVGRELFREVKADEAPEVIERMLRGYLAHRRDDQESFRDFSRRFPADQLRDLFAAQPAIQG